MKKEMADLLIMLSFCELHANNEQNLSLFTLRMLPWELIWYSIL